MFNFNYSESLLLLALAVMGNYVAETLGCETQWLLNNSMITKHALIIFIIYFTINISSDEAINPFDEMKNSVLLWLFFILFTRMNIYFTIIAFNLLCLHFILGNFETYYEKTNQNNKLENVKKLKKMITPIMIVVISFGFIIYSRKIYKDYKKHFSFYKFIFGVKKCKHNS